MKMSINEAVALMVIIIGVVLTLGYLGTNVGSRWDTVQSQLIPFITLIALFTVCIAYALRR